MSNRIDIRNESDVVVARQIARQVASQMGFSLGDQTRITTAVSELARNIFLYAKQGWIEYQEITLGVRGRGIEFIFQDQGPGIPDVELALTVGYTSGNGMGMGLSGTKRLMDEFDIKSSPGKGATIRIVRWLNK
ncbi:hypothetical protein GJ688_18150 [Heliobacillus mobilis]|uniref:Histidine kinase/HSP90-like ATPase domain-containing protein n=1 Tax=Heliobacterium mobile TaxID=28064 RepID=A0A6I3SQ52_HELMO|nr:anti-sigma regulatory factor [Heliobacterium mobile]MTV50856.1 hypothetical protein [Heliobacterium mobile]